MELEVLQPSAEVLERVAEINTALAACEATNAALDRIAAEEKTAQEQLDAAITERASVLAQRARQTDTTKIRAFDPQLKALAKAGEEASLNLESTTIARTQLEADLEKGEALVLQLRGDAKARVASAMYASDVAGDLSMRIEAVVIEHLLPLCLEAAALRDATQSSAIAEWLGELRIPLMGSAFASLLTGSDATFAGARLVFNTAWREMPALVAEHDVAIQIRRSVERLGQYVPRKQRQPTQPYVRRGYTTGNERTLAAAQERAKLEDAAQPSQQAIDRAQAQARSLPAPPTNETAAASRFREAREREAAEGALGYPDLEQFR